ncbi:MAG: hypothetical protein NTZ07_04145 [Candidatus Woesebacteria bacterium]|nr:hypothetical protein [Candidatus Woesebacteria bacterium]
MAINEEAAKIEIKGYIDRSSYSYSDWYVGIASDPEKRLFTDHRVQREGGWWIYRECFSDSAARTVEDYFVNILGTKGDTGGGDTSSVYVYAYKITDSTVE